MRIFNTHVVCEGTTTALSWQTDGMSTAAIQYMPIGGALASVTIDTPAYVHAYTLTGLTPGVTYQVRIIATVSLPASSVTTPWSTFTAYATATAPTDSAAPQAAALVPYCTLVGDDIAGEFSSWMSLSAIPGAVALADTTAVAGEPRLRLSDDALIDRLSIGMRCGPSASRVSEYLIAAQPGWLQQVATNDGGSPILTITEDFSALFDDVVDVGIRCRCTDDPATVYLVDAIDANAGTITLSEAIGATHSIQSPGTWEFALPVITLDQDVSADDASETDWRATTIARRVIEPIARAITRLEDSFNSWEYPYGITSADVSQAWFGHQCSIPSWDPTMPSDEIHVIRVATDIPATNRPALPCYAVQSPYDLTTLHAPCFFIVNSTVLFHHLTMVEELVDVTTRETTSSFTLTHALIPGTALYVDTVPEDLYGRRTIGADAYTATVVDGATVITVDGLLSDTSLCVRYDTAPSQDDLYSSTPTQHVNINGTIVLPRVHMLWNVFDELGLLLGVTRRAEATYYESNVALVTRLHAAAMLDPTPDRSHALARIAIDLGLIEHVIWSPDQEPLLDVYGASAATTVLIPEWPAYTYYQNAPLVRGPEDGTCAMYAHGPVIGMPIVTIDGRLDARQVLADEYEEVTPTDVDGFLTFTTSSAVLDDSVILYRTRAQDWKPLWPDTYLCETVDGVSTITILDDEATVRLLAESPLTIQYASVSGTSGARFPVRSLTLSTAEWKRRVDVSATYQSPNWVFDEAEQCLRAIAPAGDQSFDVFIVRDISLTALSDLAYRFGADPLIDLNTGEATDKFRRLTSRLRSLMPIIVGNARWGSCFWFSRDGSAPELSNLPSPWVVLL